MRFAKFSVAFVLAFVSFRTAFAVTYVVPTDDVLASKAQAIVIARAITSYAENSEKHGIETVTLLSIDEVLKGDLSAGAEVRVHTLGGILGKHAKFVPGAPHFADGERVLVFLAPHESGEYQTLDFGLGVFGFQTDDTGRKVAIRTATEIHGWNTDGTVHHESRRDADQFIAYLKGISNHIPMADAYTVEARPLIGEPAKSAAGRLSQTTLSFAANQYSFVASDALETSAGFRWKTFPTVVNWNRGNTEINAGNGGSDAINAAFASWNGDTNSNINYVLATTNGNLNGINSAPDGINNVVFETAVASPFLCAGGGVLGLGGVESASGDTADGDTTNVVGGNRFWTIVEGDVSMNTGVGACIGTTLSVGDFNSAVTHEIGHTLGFRHSDLTRNNSAACTTIGSYDCSSSAIMTASLTHGLSAALQTWDHSAAAAVYASAAATYNPPTAAEAHVTDTNHALVSWVAPAAGTAPGRYNVYRKGPGDVGFGFVGFATAPATSLSDPVTTGKAYLYKVRSADSGNTTESVDSNIDMATIVIYTNASTSTLSVGATVQAADLNDLRSAVDAVRSLAGGMGAGSYSFGSGSPSRVTIGTLIHAADINELRTNLNTALNAIFGTTPTYTNTISAGSSLVRALDFNELRTVMR